mmetsp:Transcript_29680/g.65759  ORF Transcript_29680/g.65759 Transcript_29680/m.65759 type:complete len:596 (-) Transcript_29680:38-1825(-)
MASTSKNSAGAVTATVASSTAIVAFLASGYFYIRQVRRKSRRYGSLAYLPNSSDENSASVITAAVRTAISRGGVSPSAISALSLRGQRAALPPMPPHWSGFIRCLQDPCDATSNPEGYVALCLAENKLCTELLATRLMSSGTAVSAFSDSIVYGYNGFLGLPAAREAVAYLLERRFLFAGQGGWSPPSTSRAGRHRHIQPIDLERDEPESLLSNDQNGVFAAPDRPQSPGPDPDRVDPEHCALGAGVASLLSHVMFVLTELNDAILIPAPYYASFESDLQALAACTPFPVYMENPRLGPNIDDLDRAAALAEREGLTVKALLLTNPHDPLGVIYRPQVMLNAISWARSRSMHTVVDEIYALSVHRRDSGFESVIRVLNNDLGDDVHMLYGLSKDFGASGFRVGMLYTHNTLLLAALANLNIFSGVSHPIQMILAELLTDDNFLDGFLDDVRAQLVWSHAICTQKLEEMVVPYEVAEAGLFVYVDLSVLLPEPTFEGERKLARLIEDAAHIVLTPGEYMRERKPGHFRICYSWVTPEVLEIAMERLSYLVKKIRRYGADGLDPKSLRDVTKAGMLMGMRRTPSINLAELTNKKSSP